MHTDSSGRSRNPGQALPSHLQPTPMRSRRIVKKDNSFNLVYPTNHFSFLNNGSRSHNLRLFCVGILHFLPTPNTITDRSDRICQPANLRWKFKTWSASLSTRTDLYLDIFIDMNIERRPIFSILPLRFAVPARTRDGFFVGILEIPMTRIFG